MLTEKNNYRYVKLITNMIGTFSSIGILTILAFNFYFNIESNGSSEMGFKVTGYSMITLNILIMLSLITALISFILKRKYKEYLK